MKLSHLGTSSLKALPTMTPARSSISATEIPISTETIDAKRIVPASSAAMAMSLISTSWEPKGVEAISGGAAVGREPHPACSGLTLAAGTSPDAESVRPRSSVRPACA